MWRRHVSSLHVLQRGTGLDKPRRIPSIKASFSPLQTSPFYVTANLNSVKFGKFIPNNSFEFYSLKPLLACPMDNQRTTWTHSIRAPIELANQFDSTNICRIRCELNPRIISSQFDKLYLAIRRIFIKLHVTLSVHINNVFYDIF